MFVCIWAEDAVRGIAKENKIPWKISQDLQLFKKLTLNHTVIMGRKTFDSLNRLSLMHRNNVVVSSTLDNKWYKNVKIFKNPIDVYEFYKDSKEEIFIIGGKSIYDFFIPKSQKLYVSKLFESFDCDQFMDNSFIDFEIKEIQKYDDFNFYVYQKDEKEISKLVMDVFE
ncbi:MAG: dihydrofolate reductase [Malacoplasma sp.]|mgnify:CR=1 FL=1|nr:dihydrofolate reductase [Malacoplasma sp.]